MVAAAVREQKHLMPACKQFYHFVGAAPGSTDLVRLLRRMWMELDADADIPGTEDDLVSRRLVVCVCGASLVRGRVDAELLTTKMPPL